MWGEHNGDPKEVRREPDSYLDIWWKGILGGRIANAKALGSEPAQCVGGA